MHPFHQSSFEIISGVLLQQIPVEEESEFDNKPLPKKRDIVFHVDDGAWLVVR